MLAECCRGSHLTVSSSSIARPVRPAPRANKHHESPAIGEIICGGLAASFTDDLPRFRLLFSSTSPPHFVAKLLVASAISLINTALWSRPPKEYKERWGRRRRALRLLIFCLSMICLCCLPRLLVPVSASWYAPES